MSRWMVRSGRIAENVTAVDQWAAWNTLRNRGADEFGLIVTAEPDENGDPIAIHTAALLFSWHRDAEAIAFIDAAVAQGLPDTSQADLATAREHGR